MKQMTIVDLGWSCKYGFATEEEAWAFFKLLKQATKIDQSYVNHGYVYHEDGQSDITLKSVTVLTHEELHHAQEEEKAEEAAKQIVAEYQIAA